MIPYLPVGRPGGPVVLVYHGLGASKEVQRKELDWLAGAGFLGIAVDAVGHGERRWPDFEERMRADSANAFLEMVRRTVDEIPALVDHLSERFGPSAFGITGISMGGFITYAAPLVEPRLRAAVSILGSPDWNVGPGTSPSPALLEQSPHRFPERYPPLALLALNAGRDVNVPAQHARSFVQRLQPLYAGSPERLAYHEYPDAEHFMPEAEWNDLWGRTVDWFRRFL